MPRVRVWYIHLAAPTHRREERYTHSYSGTWALYLSPTLTCLTCVPLIWREIMGRSPLAGQKQKPENQVTTLPASQSALQVSDRIIGTPMQKRLTPTRYLAAALCTVWLRRRRRRTSQEADLELVCRIFTKTEFSLEAFGGVEGVC